MVNSWRSHQVRVLKVRYQDQRRVTAKVVSGSIGKDRRIKMYVNGGGQMVGGSQRGYSGRR